MNAPVAVGENAVGAPRPRFKSRLEFSFLNIFASRNSGLLGWSQSEIKFIVAKSKKSFEGLKCFLMKLINGFNLKIMFQ